MELLGLLLVCFVVPGDYRTRVRWITEAALRGFLVNGHVRQFYLLILASIRLIPSCSMRLKGKRYPPGTIATAGRGPIAILRNHTLALGHKSDAVKSLKIWASCSIVRLVGTSQAYEEIATLNPFTDRSKNWSS